MSYMFYPVLMKLVQYRINCMDITISSSVCLAMFTSLGFSSHPKTYWISSACPAPNHPGIPAQRDQLGSCVISYRYTGDPVASMARAVISAAQA